MKIAIVLYNVEASKFAAAIKAIHKMTPWRESECDFHRFDDAENRSCRVVLFNTALENNPQTMSLFTRIANSLEQAGVNVDSVTLGEE